MADNVKDLFKQALKFTQDGKLDRAIESYQAIVKISPKDPRVLNNLGDLYLRKKMAKEAATIFIDLARIYEEDGYALRAIAQCQKVLKIDPESEAIRLRLSDLYTRQGLVAEARAQYLELANILDKKNKVKEALEIFGKLADLDPSNLAVRVKLGNMYHREKMGERSAAEWCKAAEGYLKANQTAQARDLLEKALADDARSQAARTMLAGEELKAEKFDRVVELLTPLATLEDVSLDALKYLSAALLRKQAFPEAAAVLGRASAKDPSSVAIRENWGLALLKAGDLPAGTDVLLKAAQAHLKENRWEKAERILQELRQRRPGDQAVLQKLVDLYGATGRNEALAPVAAELAGVYLAAGLKVNALALYDRLAELEPQRGEWRTKADLLRKETGAVAAAPPRAAAAAEPEVVIGEETLEEDLEDLAAGAELDLEEEIEIELEEEGETAAPGPAAGSLDAVRHLMARGQFKEARDGIQKFLAAGPSVEGLRALKELQRLQGRTASYVEACFDLAEFLIESGRKKEALQEYQDILKVDQRNQRAKEAMADLVVEIGVAEELPTAPPVPSPAAAAVEEEEEEETVIEIPEEELEWVGEMDLEKVVAEGPAAEAAPVPPPPPAEAESLLAEADFYFQQGLLDEAERLYRDLLPLLPGRPVIPTRLEEIARRRVAETAAPPPPVEEPPLERIITPPGRTEAAAKGEVKFVVGGEKKGLEEAAGFGDFISGLKEELEEEVAEEPPAGATVFEDQSLQEIFQEFQKGVKANLSEEDHETHYNLGIAYKEMGLYEEALAEFDLAARGGDFVTDSLSMMALIHKERGQLPRAVETIATALVRMDPRSEARKGLLWELADIYEVMGERQKAVELFQEIHGIDPEFHSIREKLAAMGVALQGAAEPAAEAASPAEAEERLPPQAPEAQGEVPAPATQPVPSKSTRVSYI